MPPTSAIHIPIEGGETTSASPEGSIFLVTYGDGLTILDEHFQKSLVDSRPVDDAGGLDKLPTSIAEAVHQDGALEPIVQSKEEALTTPQHPPSARINAVSLKGLDILDPDLAAVGVEMS